MLVFGDPLREGAEEFVALLHAKGIKVWLVSGDGESTTGSAARSVGIRHYKGQVLPDGKVDLIRTLRDQGHRVAMIGDGINDAPALATADVGCAFGANADVVREASDITFVSPDLGKLLEALELSALMSRTIRQNLFFAFFYNAVALPLAAMGLLNPLIAVLAMIGSSLTVTGNAFRISRKA
jgi:Cu+-exporting ATPase